MKYKAEDVTVLIGGVEVQSDIYVPVAYGRRVTDKEKFDWIVKHPRIGRCNYDNIVDVFPLASGWGAELSAPRYGDEGEVEYVIDITYVYGNDAGEALGILYREVVAKYGEYI